VTLLSVKTTYTGRRSPDGEQVQERRLRKKWKCTCTPTPRWLPPPCAAAALFERFEKLARLAILGFRRSFLKSICFSAVADNPLSCPRTSSEALESSGLSPEWAGIPAPLRYTATLDRIFVPLAILKAAYRNQGRVGAGAFLAGAHGVVAEQDGFHARPVDGIVELMHSPCKLVST
jgi:hypothetical protein